MNHLRPSFNFLTDVLRCCLNISTIFHPHDDIYLVKCTSPSCCKTPPQHHAATPVLHGWDGVLRLASLPPFPPNITMVIMAKQFYLFHQTRGHFSKKYNLCPLVQLQTIVWLFLWWFRSSGFFLAEWPFRLCRYRTHFTVDIDTLYTFPPASSQGPFCCSSGIDLHFLHQSTFISRRQSGMTVAWSHGV
jgi:hypothetical protein